MQEDKAINIKEVFNILSLEVKSNLKSVEGLQGFAQFYPALFKIEDNKIELMIYPLFPTLDLPTGKNMNFKDDVDEF